MKATLHFIAGRLATLSAALPLILLTSLTSYADPIVFGVSGYAYTNYPSHGAVYYVDRPDALVSVSFSVSASISYKVTTDDQSAWFGLYDWSIFVPGSSTLTGLENSGTVNKNTTTGWMIFHKDYQDTVALGVGSYQAGISANLIDGRTAEIIHDSSHTDVHFFRVSYVPDSACTALLLGSVLAAFGAGWRLCRTSGLEPRTSGSPS